MRERVSSRPRSAPQLHPQPPAPESHQSHPTDGLVLDALNPMESILLAEMQARSRAQALLTSNLSKAGHQVAMNTIANLRG